MTGVAAARSTLQSLEAQAVVGAASGGSQSPPVVNNRISVDLDGFQLRSTIREEVRFARAGIGGLA